MMFAIPRHNSLQVHDSAHDAVLYDSTDLVVHQIQDLQIDTLSIGSRGGMLTIFPDGKTILSGDILIKGKNHRPAIFELSSQKRSTVSIFLPKSPITPWQQLYHTADIAGEWITHWNTTPFSIRPKSKKSTLIEIGARFYFPPRSQRLHLNRMILPFDLHAVQE